MLNTQKLERLVKMTNRIHEQEITDTMAQLMGYNKCAKCGGGWIAQPICVMCK